MNLKTMKPVEQIQEDANVKKEAISEVVLVGGSTCIPKVHWQQLGYFGGKEPSLDFVDPWHTRTLSTGTGLPAV